MLFLYKIYKQNSQWGDCISLLVEMFHSLLPQEFTQNFALGSITEIAGQISFKTNIKSLLHNI